MHASSNSLIVVLAFAAMATFAPAAHHQMRLEVGDTVYACSCGPSCICGTISQSKGKCACGADLVQVEG